MGKVDEMAEEIAVTTDELLDLVNDLADTGRCHYDHHGYCQEHGWFKSEVECPHARAGKIWDSNGNLKVTITTPNTRQRAERAARKIFTEVLGSEHLRWESAIADIIAAEFEK